MKKDSNFDAPYTMDMNLINNVNNMIHSYIEADVANDIEMMFKVLKNFEGIVSPVINTEKEHINMLWIEQNKQHIYVFDRSTGKIIGISPTNKNKIVGMLDATFRSLVHNLEKSHIYTKESNIGGKGYFS